MKIRSLFAIEENPTDPGQPVVIRDLIGPVSVTNDAENVVAMLLRRGTLRPGQRLLYFDTDGNLDELLVRDGRFAGFAPGPGRAPR
jgi:hypothetical protein